MKSLRTLLRVTLMASGLVLGVGVAHAKDISGVIENTLTIMEDSQLVDDVTCKVRGAPCIRFGAPGITLRLNGFTMTGLADSTTGCKGDTIDGEQGISTDGQSDTAIVGPGLVQSFRNQGILVSGGSRVQVTQVTASTNCASGILVSSASSNNLLEANVLVRNGSARPGFRCGGICIAGSSNRNRIRGNQTSGNGYVDRPDNFGIGIVSGNENLIEENSGVGNTNGIILFEGVIGNLVRQNTFVGNPPIQISVSFPDDTGVDIRNLADPEANTFEDNLCLTSIKALCPNFPK
jgi:parallel beta-helix repeat protein